MESKILFGVVGIVVSIILVGSLMMPIIDTAVSIGASEEIEPVSGGYGPSMIYQNEPEITTETNSTYYYFRATYSNGTITFKSGPYGNTTITSIDSNELTDKTLIVYSDSLTTIYIKDGKYHSTTPINGVSEIDLTTPGIGVNYAYNDGGVKYQFSQNLREQPVPSHYYSIGNDGDYINFVGDNPPAMDTPTVSVEGVYIGEKYHTVMGENPLKPLYYAIPLTVIIAVLVFAVGVFVSKRY